MFGTEAFVALDPVDRQALADWLGQVNTGTVEMVADLASRPWQVSGMEMVIGVFEKGSQKADWLLVRYQSRWVLATVADNSVSEVCDSLVDALRLIRGDPT